MTFATSACWVTAATASPRCARACFYDQKRSPVWASARTARPFPTSSDEEKKRQYSISTSVIPVEYNKCKINVLDNPGYFDFAGQIVQSLRVSDAGLICLTAKSGIGVGTEKGWRYLAKAGLPAMFYVSKLDEEHANFFNVFDSLREMFGVCHSVHLPDSQGRAGSWSGRSDRKEGV